ncbi:MAG: PKD domain-containing protein [Bacteroidota bacterium]
MKKPIQITLFLLLICLSKISLAQSYPVGLSIDSISMADDLPYVNLNYTSSYWHKFTVYKPSSYDSLTSPIVFAIHGTGGSGNTTAGILQDIANRRKAIIIAPNMTTFPVRSGDVLETTRDTVTPCSQLRPGIFVFKNLYKHIIQKESRGSIPTYMIGFSVGAQFVSRYLIYRTSYPDSIPLKMAVSADPYYYTFPTENFNGETMWWLCGFIQNPAIHYSGPPFYTHCDYTDSLLCFFCNDNAIQYYNENYGILIGTADTDSLFDTSCLMIQGVNRYERAQTFYAFCDSNAINRGTTLKWEYAEVPNIGHSELYLYTTKASPTDSSTIAETLLFDTPYHTPLNIAPVAEFYTSSYKIADTINAGDTIFFINASYNTNSYIWYFGDSTTSTAVNPYHVYNTAGSYEVILSARNANGCRGWRSKRNQVRVIGTVGVKEDLQANFNVQLIPNPAHEHCELKIEGDGLKSIKTGELFSAQGVKILTLFNSLSLSVANYNQTININNLSAGIYYIKVCGDNGYVIKKLVVY